MTKHVVIIGGGIAGLTAAYYLKKCNIDVTILERGSYTGGAIRTDLKKDNYLVEYGPNTFLSSSKPIQDLTEELGLAPHIVTNKKASKKRYVYRRGQLHLVPTHPKDFLRSPLISRLGKLRVLLEPIVRSKSNGLETLAEFVKRRAGNELLENIVDPFVSGIYAGDPYQLEMRSIFPRLMEIEEKYGSVLKGMRHMKSEIGDHQMLSYKWGMESLPARLSELMPKNVETDTNAETIEQTQDKTWLAITNTYKDVIEADAIIIAAPATEAARLLMPYSPQIFAPLMGMPYVSLTVVHTAFRKADVPMDLEGFGFLIPRSERIRLLGSIWSSSLFPDRAPNGEVLLTNFIGGALDPNSIDLDNHDLLTHVRTGLEKTLGISAEPRFYHIHRVNQAIPQYTIGHANRLKDIENYLKKLSGVFLTGSYFKGISVSDTIEHAKETAILAGRYLASTTSIKKRKSDTARKPDDNRIDSLHSKTGKKPDGGVRKID